MTNADRLCRRIHEIAEIGRFDRGVVSRRSLFPSPGVPEDTNIGKVALLVDLVVPAAVSLRTRGVTVTSKEQSA